MRFDQHFVLCLAVALMVGGDANAELAPPADPFVIEVDVPAGVLRLKQVGDLYVSERPVTIRVGSILPRWRISVVPDRFTGPAGGKNITPPQVSIRPARDLANPGKSFGGQQIPIKGSTVLALGGATAGKIVEVNSFTITVAIDPLSPPGTYGGTLRIVPEIPGKSHRQEFSVHYEWNVVELLSVNTQTDVMGFDITGPGITECANPAVFQIYSNNRQAEITISLEPLTGVGNGVTLPPEASAIGWGTSPALAYQDASTAPFGRNDLRFVLGPGQHKIAVFARLQLSTAEPAGRYTGQIVITSRVID